MTKRKKQFPWRIFLPVLLIVFIIGIGIVTFPYTSRMYREHKARQYISEETNIKKEPAGYCHFSIDDCITVFEDLTAHENDYESIFDNETLHYLRYLHDTYGTVISMYCYYEDGNFNLSQATDHFSGEFKENADWIKVGFHSRNANDTYENTSEKLAEDDYLTAVTELKRICGGNESLDTFVRLSRFQGNKDSILGMKNSTDGITGLLAADDDRGSYYLTEQEENQIKSEEEITVDGINYLSTDCRIENIKSLRETENNLKNDPQWIIFTHEYLLDSIRYEYYIENLLLDALESGYQFAFPMNEE